MKFASVLVAFVAATVAVFSLSLPRMDGAAQTPSRRQIALRLPAEGLSPTAGPVPYQAPHAPQTPVSFTPDQINALRAQIYALKVTKRGIPVPERSQQAIHAPNQAIPDPQTLPHRPDVNTDVIDSAVSAVKIHNTVDGTPVNVAVEQPLAEVAAPPQPAKEEEVEVVDPEKIPKGPDSDTHLDPFAT